MALTDNLISYWKLDEASGNAVDSEPTSPNTLVNQNTMSYGTGKINNAASLASVGNKFLKIANADQTGLDILGDITVSLWVKTSENSKYILHFTDGATGVGYGIAMGTAAGKPIGQMAIFVGQNWFTTTSATRIDNNVWYHIAFTMSGTSVALYLDGTADGTGTASSGLSHTGDRAIGSSLTTNTLNALVDEVGIWNRALSASEISSLYNGGAGLQYPFVPTLVPSVVDTLAITESTTQTLISNINVNDILSITESATQTLISNINVNDTLSITESTTLSNTQLGDISVNDILSITESATQTLISNISVSDQLTITESVSQTLLFDISISDILTITEDVTRILISYINIVETTLIIEEIIINNSDLGGINTNETLAITETSTITNATLAGINLNEVLSVTESLTITNATLSGISLNETLSITENVTTLETEEGGNPSVSDALTLTENLIVSISLLGGINLSETLALTESVTMFETETGGNPEVSDTLAIAESITLENFRFSPSRTVPVGSVRVFSPYGR